MSDTRETFRAIFHDNRWNSDQSVSGPGSTLRATTFIRAALPDLLARLEIKTIVDAPCGDGNWFQHLEYEFDDYLGVDIVPEIIERMQRQASPARRYMVGDIVTDVLPTADATLCRDCLVHLPFAMGQRAVVNWKAAGFKFLLVTHFPGWENQEGKLGRWRRLNMQGEPFNFPEPIAVIRERRPNHADNKSLGVWRTADIP